MLKFAWQYAEKGDKMEKKFISATKEYSELERHIPAPYLRRSFRIDEAAREAKIRICGLGFYILYINGKRVSKGHIAPYISNPDHVCYYDTFDVTELFSVGENVIGVILGNGVYEAGAVKGTPYMNEAYEMGKGV